MIFEQFVNHCSRIPNPIIGVTCDYSEKATYSSVPWYALRKNYCDAISEAGGTPVLLPYNLSAIPQYCELIDGLVITGGDFDIDPRYYQESVTSANVSVNELRTQFEMTLFKEFYPLQKPILGICGGMQLINVALGGTLVQDIHEKFGTNMHEQKTPKNMPSHPVSILSATKIHQAFNLTRIMVNSTHHQAIKDLSALLIASAVAEDGIIEAIEHQNHKWCLGVQWHPEYFYKAS